MDGMLRYSQVPSPVTGMNTIWDYALGGVNFSIPGNGGLECAEYLPLWQKILETILFVPLSIYGIIISSKKLDMPSFVQKPRDSRDHHHYHYHHQSSGDGFSPSTTPTPFSNTPTSELTTATGDEEDMAIFSNDENSTRYSVLAFYSLIFGAEVAYKLITRTCIFLLNPCHVATMLQIVLLTMRTNKRHTCLLFRFHMYLMSGALIALAFPVLNTRLLPGEVFIYFVQHLLILTVPLFMIYLKGAYLPESSQNVAWPTLGFSIIILYHYTILQFIGVLTHVNVSCILCPAVSDPFRGRFYRLATVTHQGILVPLVTKIYNACAVYIIQAIQWCYCMDNSNAPLDDCTNFIKKAY